MSEERFIFFVQKNGMRTEFPRLTKKEAETMYEIVKRSGHEVFRQVNDPNECYGYEPEWRNT
jgi:hypothetical protein